jgi:hypothetical protein
MPFTKRKWCLKTFEKGKNVFFDFSRPQTFETRCSKKVLNSIFGAKMRNEQNST